jgi:hypothetical protein
MFPGGGLMPEIASDAEVSPSATIVNLQTGCQEQKRKRLQ